MRLNYYVEKKEMNELLNLLHGILGIRITFFGPGHREIDYFDMARKDSAYCACLRRDPAFDAKCIACDVKNLEIAKKRRRRHVYRCHHGLIEGLVPLFDGASKYLGSLFFGQVRETGKALPESDAHLADLYAAVPAYSFAFVDRIGRLAGLLCDYVLLKNIIKAQNKAWVEKLFNYIHRNLHRDIRLNDLAAKIGRSPSFISHYFKKEFGLSAKQFVLREKMRRAAALLKSGAKVREAAEKLGFYDEFHFSKAFKHVYGKPPREYKR